MFYIMKDDIGCFVGWYNEVLFGLFQVGFDFFWGCVFGYLCRFGDIGIYFVWVYGGY